MKLPELLVPTYNIELPISKQKIKFRPWLVKEQKILLMATEGKENNSVVEALIQVLNNCLITDIDINTLPQVDVEYYFYQLRAKSQSEIVTSKYKCEHLVDSIECGAILEHEFNLTTDLDIINLDIKDTIELTDTVGIKLHAPYFETEDLSKEFEDLTAEDLFNEVIKHVDFIYDENSVYMKGDMESGQLLKFLEELLPDQFEKIDNYFMNLPKIIKKLDITCKKCGYKHDIIMEDIFSFFI